MNQIISVARRSRPCERLHIHSSARLQAAAASRGLISPVSCDAHPEAFDDPSNQQQKPAWQSKGIASASGSTNHLMAANEQQATFVQPPGQPLHAQSTVSKLAGT